MSQKREFRKLSGEIRVETIDGGKKIVGYGAVFGQLSEPLNIKGRTMRERVMPGAFKRCLERGADIRGLVNHNADMVLGRTTSGTMRVSEDEHGLRYEIDPPDTSYARDLMVSLERGDINQSSFGFYTVNDDVVPGDDGLMVRELHEVDCFDCSPVTYPAYAGATSGLRDAEELRSMFPDGLPDSLESETAKNKRANEDGCGCDCQSCEDNNCEGCSMVGCEDTECCDAGCQMQVGGRSGNKDGEQRDDAKTKKVDGKDLHAPDFAHVGDPEDTSTWKLPIHDAGHVRNALARFNQVQGLSDDEKNAAWKKILAAAKKFGIHVSEQNSSKLLATASYRDAKAVVRAIDPDGDGDDDEPLIDALIDAREGCSTVANTASGALWTFFDGDDAYSNPMLEAFVKQSNALIADLQAAIAEVTKELAEPTGERSAEPPQKKTALQKIARMAELEKD